MQTQLKHIDDTLFAVVAVCARQTTVVGHIAKGVLSATKRDGILTIINVGRWYVLGSEETPFKTLEAAHDALDSAYAALRKRQELMAEVCRGDGMLFTMEKLHTKKTFQEEFGQYRKAYHKARKRIRRANRQTTLSSLVVET